MLEGHNFFENDADIAKTSFSVFVTILYIKVLYILVMILEPYIQPWKLSEDDKQISISKDVINDLKNQDLIAVNFLYQNFKNGFKGSILNEEDGFDMQTQVSIFLQVMFNIWSRSKNNFLVLVITPEYLMQKWSKKLIKLGELKVQTVGPKTCPEDFDQKHGVALLLSFDYIKFAETLAEYNFALIIIDHLDTVAKKIIIKKLAGDFNIGLTRRNFYINPDQKLQWAMLNWVHPGSVGRLIDFYEADNDNFANIRDNYHHWWLTLTGDYCETFTKESEDPENDSNSFVNVKRKKNTRKKKTGKKIKIESSDENIDNDEDEFNSDDEVKTTRNIQSEQISKINVNCGKTIDTKEEKNDRDSNSSDDTVEYNIHSPSYKIEHPLLDASIETNLSFNQLDDDEDQKVLLNIIQGVSGQNSSKKIDYQSQIDLKKQELYSQIIDEVPESQSQRSDSSEDFLLSLINS